MVFFLSARCLWLWRFNYTALVVPLSAPPFVSCACVSVCLSVPLSIRPFVWSSVCRFALVLIHPRRLPVCLCDRPSSASVHPSVRLAMRLPFCSRFISPPSSTGLFFDRPSVRPSSVHPSVRLLVVCLPFCSRLNSPPPPPPPSACLSVSPCVCRSVRSFGRVPVFLPSFKPAPAVCQSVCPSVYLCRPLSVRLRVQHSYAFLPAACFFRPFGSRSVTEVKNPFYRTRMTYTMKTTCSISAITTCSSHASL